MKAIETVLGKKTRIPSGIWSCLYGWLLWICVPRIGSFPSALNTWSKVWPWILIWAYLILNFAPIFGQQISILDPPPLHWTFWSVLVWTFTLWVNLGLREWGTGVQLVRTSGRFSLKSIWLARRKHSEHSQSSWNFTGAVSSQGCREDVTRKSGVSDEDAARMPRGNCSRWI